MPKPGFIPPTLSVAEFPQNFDVQRWRHLMGERSQAGERRTGERKGT